MATNSKGQLVNRSGLADVFGVALPTIDGWVKSGCPCVKRGGRGQEWQFNTADISIWLRDRAVSDATGDVALEDREIDRRTKMAKMLTAELELSIAKGEVAPVREFERASAMMDAAIRANVMNVPGRAVLQLLGCTDEAEFKTKLRAELVLALETAASTDIEIDDETADDAVA
jgi:phage terminase Nu1 subunit (DNA packaging protein)